MRPGFSPGRFNKLNIFKMASAQEETAGTNVEYNVNGKLVEDMKVEELKAELERRGLKRSGVKKDLQERLSENISLNINKDSTSTEISSTADTQSSSEYGSTSDIDNSKKSDNEVPNATKDEKDENQTAKDNVEEGFNQPEADSTKKENTEIEDGEIIIREEEKKNDQKEVEPVPDKKRRISLTRHKLADNTTPSGNRKRKWSSHKNKSSVVISTDSLKGLIPGVQLASTPALEAVMEFDDDKDDEEEMTQENEDKEEKEEEMGENISENKQEEKSSNKKTRIVHVEESKTVKLNNYSSIEPADSDEMAVTSSNKDVASNGITEAVNPDEEMQSSTESSEATFIPKRAVSPPRKPPSNVVHVVNLVRPFTQNQLNQLLSKFGTLVEGGFWINKIKSHCYVTYSSVDEAKVARDSLHSQRWPNTSPKILNVDFGDDEQMMEDTDGLLGKAKEEKIENEKEKETKKETEKETEKDLEKDIEKGKDRRRHKERKEQKSKQQKEPSAANLLDKLFRKTTTEPCIYWLPLTKEQIAKKEIDREERLKQRQLVLQEREKLKDDRLKEKEREIVREKGGEKERELGRGKERETGREKVRETGGEKERETSRGRDRKPLRENRASSPPPRSFSDRRSPDVNRNKDDRKR